jgi:hypothetical protein
MYKIYIGNQRYNSKKFSSYEEARKWLRRRVTYLTGRYQDTFTDLGFSISKS